MDVGIKRKKTTQEDSWVLAQEMEWSYSQRKTKVSGPAHLRNTRLKSPTDSKRDGAGSWMEDMTSEERSSEDGTGVSSQELHRTLI